MDLRSEIEARKKKLKATKTIVTNAAGEAYEMSDGVERKLEEKRWGFVIDEKPDMQIARIAEGLFLSSQDPATSEELLRTHGIRHVLSLGIKNPVEFDEINYYFLDFLDLPEFQISTVIEKSLKIINHCRSQNILVHCNAGVSRSATIIIAYLMATEKLSYEEAHERVKSQRNCIRPNSGFVQQLKSLQNLENMNPQGGSVSSDDRHTWVWETHSANGATFPFLVPLPLTVGGKPYSVVIYPESRKPAAISLQVKKFVKNALKG